MSRDSITIMNYRGALPDGVWYCDGCPFETLDEQQAARHSVSTWSWLWLFQRHSVRTSALYEMHPSDLGGVYLNSTTRDRMTIQELRVHRERRPHSPLRDLEVFDAEPVSDEEWDRLHAHENVRNTDPDTSHQTAYNISGRGLQRARYWKLFRQYRRLTDDRLRDKYTALYGPVGYSSPSKRRGDLVKMGLVRDSGDRALLNSGRMGIVWEIVDDQENSEIARRLTKIAEGNGNDVSL